MGKYALLFGPNLDMGFICANTPLRVTSNGKTYGDGSICSFLLLLYLSLSVFKTTPVSGGGFPYGIITFDGVVPQPATINKTKEMHVEFLTNWLVNIGILGCAETSGGKYRLRVS